MAGIAQHAFQIHDAALRQVEIIADADCGVNVYRKMQAAAFLNEITENVILKSAVIDFARNAT